MKDFLKGIVYVGIFAIPFIPLIVTDSMFFPFITGKNFTFRIIVEVIFSAWVLLALIDATYRPRFSWLLAGLSSFILVMFVANFLGEYPLKSFWSNFERMDGYVTLIHFYMLFVVLGHFMFDRTLWLYLFGTSLAVATYMAFDGWSQYLTATAAKRVDSNLGNAAYMAIYMLFHAFFAIWVFMQTKNVWLRTLLALIFFLFVYVLLLTGTRGTFIALVGGTGLVGLYMVLFSRTYPVLKKISMGVLVAVVLFVGGIYVFKDSTFVTESVSLNRIASINLEEDLRIRSYIWNMALEGVAERPVLGWGQGNFNYIFNEKYDPNLYSAESWYDRAHNIILDWLVAGGVLGLLAYLSIFAALAYYLFWVPFRKHDEANNDRFFTVPERAVLIGLLAAYFVHNLVVFDNIVSYIFFAFTLGLIHSRIGKEMPEMQAFTIDQRIVTNIIAPVILVIAGTAIYFVNVPAIRAATDIIDALQQPTIPERLAEMESALSHDSFAYQEIVEQFAQQAMNIAANQNIAPEQKQAFVASAEEALLKLAEKKPGDARVHVFIGGFYRNIGAFDKAKEQVDIARSLSPTKQAIILEQGVLAYQMKDFAKMHEYFKEAYELQHSYHTARNYYATSFMYIGQPERIEEVITEDTFKTFALEDFALQSAEQFKLNDLLKRMFEVRIAHEPENQQYRISLAYLYWTEDNLEKATEVLRKGVEEIPAFKKSGECFIGNIERGEEPGTGC